MEIAYNGTAYHGWQRQPNAHTIEEALTQAMCMLFQLTDIKLVASGRTDAGVHAKQQFAHVDLPHLIPNIKFRLNKLLPDDISVVNLYHVPSTYHARFDAIERAYRYIMVIQKDPFLVDGAYNLMKPLHLELLNQASQLLIGEHDFQCFSKSHSGVHHHICNVFDANWQVINNQIHFNIKANRFLRGMVRAIVGTLFEVGTQKFSIQEFKQILVSKNRKLAGKSMPAHGLYLENVKYPDDYQFKKVP